MFLKTGKQTNLSAGNTAKSNAVPGTVAGPSSTVPDPLSRPETIAESAIPGVVDVRGVLGVPGTSKLLSSTLSVQETVLNGLGFLIMIARSFSPS